MMNTQHSQMRQQHPTPYGQQPMPPVPPQHQGGGPPQTGHEDSASLNTGEASEFAPPPQEQPLQLQQHQQQQHQQPQYMQQMGAYGVVPPGGYPGYHYGQMQPQGRVGPPPPPPGAGGYQGPPPGNLHHAQMQVLPGAPYGAQRMYAPPYQHHMMNPQQMGMPSLGAAAASSMMRGGPPPYYGGVGPGMGYGPGYPQHVGGGNPDQDNNMHRNNNMQRGGGRGSAAGRGRHKINRPGRGFQHQNSLNSQDSRSRYSNDASPNGDGGGGDAAGGGGSAERGAPDVSTGAASEGVTPTEAGE